MMQFLFDACESFGLVMLDLVRSLTVTIKDWTSEIKRARARVEGSDDDNFRQ